MIDSLNNINYISNLPDEILNNILIDMFPAFTSSSMIPQVCKLWNELIKKHDLAYIQNRSIENATLRDNREAEKLDLLNIPACILNLFGGIKKIDALPIAKITAPLGCLENLSESISIVVNNRRDLKLILFRLKKESNQEIVSLYIDFESNFKENFKCVLYPEEGPIKKQFPKNFVLKLINGESVEFDSDRFTIDNK